MNLTKSAPHAVAAGATGRRLQVSGQQVSLDAGHVYIVSWPDAAAMAANISVLCNLASPTIRLAGGALVGDLSLHDNLMAEPLLQQDFAPTYLLPEIESLFGLADCHVSSAAWADTCPDQADVRTVMQVQVGRALVADPDVLLVDAARWDDFVLSPKRFSQSFVTQFPWRTLIWATHDPSRADRLRVLLQELCA